MSNFVFDSGIPFAQNNPSSDQPKMLANNIANEGIWDVDHIGFNSNNGGTHLQNSYEGFSLGTLLPGTPASTAYPAAGVASSTRSQYYFKNTLGTYLLSSIKAFGVFVTQNTNGVIPPGSIMGMNIVSITASGNGQINTIDLTPNAVTGTVVAVFADLSGSGDILSWTMAANTLTITINAGATAARNLSFAILQT